MTKLVTNIDINSVTLETRHDENTGNILNQAFVSTSLIATSKQSLKFTSLRLIVSLSRESSKPIDFITQRYNEFKDLNLEDTSSQQYNRFLQGALGKQEDYLRSSSPFSPYSTNLEARNLVMTNRISKLGDGSSVAKDIIIYDIPVIEAIGEIKNGVALVDPIRIDLPATTKDLSQMSLYMFAYDTRVANFLKANPVDNFSINTGMSKVAVSTPLGDRVVFLTASVEEPLVGMQEESTLTSPDANKLRSIEAPPTDFVVKKYTSIAEKAQELFTTYQKSKNYELNKVLKRENYFSDFWLSRDLQDNHKFVFAFDVRSYLSKNGIFPFVYRNQTLSRILIGGGNEISPDTLSSVRSVEVFRHQVETQGVLATNDLGTTGPVVELGPSKEFPMVPVRSVKKVDISLPRGDSPEGTSYKISFFEGQDTFGIENEKSSQVNGKYQYSAKCVIVDNSPEMMRKLADTLFGLRRSTVIIHDYLINSPLSRQGQSLYNSKSGRLNVDIKSIDTSIDGENINIAAKLLENIEKYEVFINALSSGGENIELVKFYQNSFDSDGGRIRPNIIKDLESLIDLGIRFVYEKLKKVFPLDPFGRKESSSVTSFAQNSSRMSKSNLTTIEHLFSGIYEKGKNNGYGLDYIFGDDDEQDTLNNITLDGYQSRRVEEFKKYFSAGAEAGEPVPGGSFEDPSYAYMTAKTIRTPHRTTIEQPKYASENTNAVEYDFDRYGQLFTDILSLKHQRDDLGMFYPTLFQAGGDQKPNNKMYSSVITLLAEQFSVSIGEVVIPQFSIPQVVRDGSKTTIYNRKERESCGPNGGLPLIQSVIGGENTQDSTTELYLQQVNDKIEGESTERDRGAIDEQAQANDRKERAIKLPFAILGELTLEKVIGTAKNYEQEVFNSLTELRKILNISKSDIEQTIESSTISQMPNQLKSMLVISSTDGVSSFGGSDGSSGFDACRPKIKDRDDPSSIGDLVSFFGDQEDIPPYPQTEDPMKTYARFLTFWMNYRQIAVVEYLDGFNSLKDTANNIELIDQKLKLDSWTKMSAATAQSLRDRGGSILCRARLMGVGDYISLLGDTLSEEQGRSLINFFETKELLNFPTYNQYFYIQSELPNESPQEAEELQEIEEPQQQRQPSFVVGY